MGLSCSEMGLSFIVQRIDAAGTVVTDDVTGFSMTYDGAQTMCRYLRGRYSRSPCSLSTSQARRLRGSSYVVVPVWSGGEE